MWKVTQGYQQPMHFYCTCLVVAQMVKNLSVMPETWVRSLGLEDSLEKGMATHSSILAWRIPWTDEPGRLQSLGSQRVGHDRVTNIFTFMVFMVSLSCSGARSFCFRCHSSMHHGCIKCKTRRRPCLLPNACTWGSCPWTQPCLSLLTMKVSGLN